MLYSNTNGAYPDLNFFFAPFCIPDINNKTILNNYINSFQLHSYPSIFPYFNNYHSTTFWPNQFNFNNINSNQNFIPKIAKVQIIKKNENNQNHNENNKIKNKLTKSKKLFSISSSSNNNLNNEESTNEFSFDNISVITNDEITKFNTDSKLKKIHSTYHLKRKFTTKLQNDIKDNLNKLIAEINMNIKSNKLPFISPNSKQFREDIKIESLKKNKNLTIGKYISEDIQNAERSLNINNNFKVVQKIEKIYENYKNNNNDDDNIFEIVKKLYFLINKTIVFDYYEKFLKSERFKKCFEKDLMKYHNKLKNLKFSKEKIDLYCEIFKEKYEGIAKSYFTC